MQDPARPFQLVKYLSWGSFLLILVSSLLLSVLISNSARKTILQKKQELALLLAENLNHQIYQRFTLPTVIGFGRVQLKEQGQYDRLDQVVVSTVHGFHPLDIRIYDNEFVVSYSSEREELGRSFGKDPLIKRAIDEGKSSFDLHRSMSNWRAMLSLNLPEETFVLRTVYPLRAERDLRWRTTPGPLMGVLEFTLDVTKDYREVIHFQWLVTGISFGSFLILFLLLFGLINRADRIFAERVRDKERLERELHQNEKLAGMGRVVASIAHEIRNPLGIIRSSAELLLKRAKKEGNAMTPIVEAIFEESKRLSSTVNDFLDYARPKQPKRDRVDLTAVTQRVVDFVSGEWQSRGVGIVFKPSGPSEVLGDSDLLYRAVYNLVVNGCQATESSGGSVEIRVEAGPSPSVVITDQGPGFEPELLDKYLEPFYTTKDSGTGLGLAIVDTIAQGHGAALILENRKDGGALVRLTFSDRPV
ncbi:MAG: two-component sensor histidine kinase [Deltaproteobacteria bacterium]|nr:two-component sensor histidine kinase [Deltaproteobacteria bacterium]